MRRLIPILTFSLLALWPSKAGAVLLDWNSVNWPSGNLSQSFNLENAPGDTVSFTISGDTGDLASDVNDTTDLTGGQGGTQQSLFINVDFNSTGLNYIIVTVEFGWWAGAEDVSFTLFDVDRINGQFRDRIAEIIAKDMNNNDVAATITTSKDNDLSGSGTGQFVRGSKSTDEDDDDGNVGISFGSTPIKSFSFKYSNDDAALGNQWIGFYDLSYKRAVPEFHPSWGAGLACVLAGLSRLRGQFMAWLRRLRAPA